MIPHYLADVAATGAEVSIIAEPREVVIDCRGCGIGDRHLLGIAQEEDLTWLSLYGCNVSNDGVRTLCRNRKLEYLDLGLTSVDGSILSIVPMLPGLCGIGLEGVREVDAEIRFLMNHRALDAVDLSGTDVTPGNLRTLLVNSNLTLVKVAGTTTAASDVLDLDDIDAEPYRTVGVQFSERQTVALVMLRRELEQIP